MDKLDTTKDVSLRVQFPEHAPATIGPFPTLRDALSTYRELPNQEHLVSAKVIDREEKTIRQMK